jgi:hypothetical protein
MAKARRAHPGVGRLTSRHPSLGISAVDLSSERRQSVEYHRPAASTRARKRPKGETLCTALESTFAARPDAP